jgi:hypothetical protein
MHCSYASFLVVHVLHLGPTTHLVQWAAGPNTSSQGPQKVKEKMTVTVFCSRPTVRTSYLSIILFMCAIYMF